MISLRRLASGFGLRGIDVAVQALAALWVSPILIHSLGRERYGLWVVLLTIVGYIDLADFGLTSAVTRYVSRALGRKDQQEAHDVIASAFAILLWIGAASLLVIAAMAVVVPMFLGEAAAAGPVPLIVLILGATGAVSFPLRVFTGVLEAHVRYEFTTGASIIRTVLTTVALWWVATHGADLLAVVTVVCTGSFLQRALTYFFARSVVPEMRLFPLRLAPSARAMLLAYGWKNFLIKLIDIVRFRIDNVVIAHRLSVGMVALYAPGMSLIRYFREAMDCLGGVFMPVFSAADGVGDREALRRHLARALKASAALSTFIGGSLLLYGGWFVERWLGPDFRESYLVMLVLAPSVILAMAQLPGVVLFFATSRQEQLIRLHAAEGALNLALSLTLVGPWGIYGVAAGTAIALFVSKCIVQPWMVCALSGLKVRHYYGTAILLPMAKVAAPMLLAWWLLTPWMRADYPHLLAALAAQTALVAPVAWWLLFSVGERGQVLGLLRGRR